MHIVAPMVAHMRIKVLSLLAKSCILIWDTGASYGLTLFRSDFIDYVKCEIPVKDVTKVNKVVGKGMTLLKFTDINGNPIYFPCVLYHLPETVFVCSLLKRITRCMVDTQKSIAIAYACY